MKQAPINPVPVPPVAAAELAAIRGRLERLNGQQYWRSLEEVAATPQFKALLEREFPPGASEWWDGLSRRNFLRMAAASLALAGVTACTKQPTREIFPYVKQPEELVLGQPLYYASTMPLGGFGTGVLVKSREGHPIKVDGNPEHPASLGGSSVWLQTSILNLYDPDRSQTVTHNGDISSWDLFLSELNELVQEQQASHGAGLQFLTETVTSPTLAAQLQGLLRRFPRAKWHQYDPVSRDNVLEGSRLAFGRFVETHHHFDRADVILALDSDFLYAHPQRLRYTRHFIDGRRVSSGQRRMNRLYVVESTPTVTGTMAEHRLALPSGQIEALAFGLARRLAPRAWAGEGGGAEEPAISAQARGWVDRLAAELRQHRGTGILIAGQWQPPVVHALVHWLNQFLGNAGNTVEYSETAQANPVNQLDSLQELVADMSAGAVGALFILGGNPVHSAPADLEFDRHLSKIKRSVHLGLELNETAARCSWHIPEAYYLESWGDARAFDGTVSMVQPLIAPLYNGKSAYELLDAMVHQQPLRSDYEIVRDFWQKQNPSPGFDLAWRRALHDGVIPNTQNPPVKVEIAPEFERRLPQLAAAAVRDGRDAPGPGAPYPSPQAEGKRPGSMGGAAHGPNANPMFDAGAPHEALSAEAPLEVCFRPDPCLWDGRFANNGWLQECAKPVNKLTWDNAVLVSPALAERLGLATNDVVEVALAGRTVRGPVWVMPGQAETSLTLHLGYGRERTGRVGAGVGFNAYRLRTTKGFWSATGATLVRTGERHSLVSTQTHHQLRDPERQVFRAATLEQFAADPDVIRKTVAIPPVNDTLYYPEEYPYRGYKWGMSIDLTACIGCNACVVACEVENNIPVVGKEQVAVHREMYWIRVDTYYRGSLDSPQFNHMPVPCMQCEHAPCELVCPVEATVHDHEGLNLQIYNRCVGTRFCSNNCPYKVRRFNFLRYTDYHTPNFKPMYNPEVTVRWRGVMEKCTYCIQRIAAGRITAEKEDRRIRDGEVRPACQVACPARAIVFGDLNTPGSEVARLKTEPLDYPMLGELNTRPRTTYLAKLTNPNPDLATEPAPDHGEKQ
jgi:MoCo/4Fe-4S cofactor protein with predicted Tat translocation signal